MSEAYQLLRNIPEALFLILAALIGAFVVLYAQRIGSRATVFGRFIEVLSGDIAALNADGSDSDAYSILQDRFIAQHDAFIQSFHVAGMFGKRRLKHAWKAYYGEEGEQEWWLPNEYSALMSNQLKNTNENTRQLAIHRLKYIINVCK